jgi:hypothetical protein
MSRVVLAPENPPKYRANVERTPDGGVVLMRPGTPQHFFVNNEGEARHLALWLRDQGFFDDGAVESTCRHCSGVVRCFNHDCEGTPHSCAGCANYSLRCCDHGS